MADVNGYWAAQEDSLERPQPATALETGEMTTEPRRSRASRRASHCRRDDRTNRWATALKRIAIRPPPG
jgi:hypothetical protein